MKGKTYFKYYKFKLNDTAIVTVWANNFRPSPEFNCNTIYQWPPKEEMFYGFTDLVTALVQAKAGAVKYMDILNKQGASGAEQLVRYRFDHYEDLDINLTDENINKVRTAIALDSQYTWQPYYIESSERAKYPCP